MKNLILALLFLVPMGAFGVADCEVSNVALCSDAVITSKLATGAVTSAKILDGTITLDDMSTSALTYRDTTISAAQLDAMNATPISLVPAPGAGIAVDVSSIFCFVDFVATRAELGAGTIDFKYTDSSGAAVAVSLPNTTMELNSDTYYTSAKSSAVPVVNAAVVAHASADVTAGDSLLKCRTFYRLVTISDI